MVRFSAELDELADRQSGVLSRPQLTALGVPRSSIHLAVRRRAWRLVGRAVVVHRQPLSREARWWVAVIHAGPGALLASCSAAEAQGLKRFESEWVHVVVSMGHRVRALPWMKVHVSRRLRAEDRHPGRELPMVGVARAPNALRERSACRSSSVADRSPLDVPCYAMRTAGCT